MSGSHDRSRSRSPMFIEGDTEITMMLRMQDKIRALEQQLAEKNIVIKDLKAAAEDRQETIMELKVQIVECNKKIKELEDCCVLKPGCALPTVTRAALDAVCKHDESARVVEQRIMMAAQWQELVKLREQLQQKSEEVQRQRESSCP